MARLSWLCGSTTLGWCFLSSLLLSGAILGASVPGCASGGGQDTGTPPLDTGGRLDVGDGGVRADTPATFDVGPDVPARDAGPGCGGMVCMGLTHCVDSACVDYPPCRGDNTCPTPGDVCSARRCIPGTDDPDGDGSPASEDCDETDPTRNPDLPEICNMRDDNCNGAPDEGDPATMCSLTGMRGICMAGTCSCAPGTYDFDLMVPGCECTATPAAGTGLACTSAIDLGSFADTGSNMMVSANALGREVWYTFNATDTPDTTCDNFYVRVQLMTNPDGAYEMTVFRGTCDPTECGGGNMTDYTWATDFPATGAPLGAGECPCSSATGLMGPGTTGMNACNDSTARYYVRVRRAASAADACAPFQIEISNGVYSTM